MNKMYVSNVVPRYAKLALGDKSIKPRKPIQQAIAFSGLDCLPLNIISLLIYNFLFDYLPAELTLTLTTFDSRNVPGNDVFGCCSHLNNANTLFNGKKRERDKDTPCQQSIRISK